MWQALEQIEYAAAMSSERRVGACDAKGVASGTRVTIP